MVDKQNDLLKEMAKWLRFMGMREAREVVENALTYDDKEKEKDAKITYQLTNGENRTSDIEKYISFSYRWVSSRHQEWAKIGIVEKEGPQEPYKHIISIDALGIDCPDIPEPDEDEEDSEASESDEESEQVELKAE
jgi:hypothetical protein